MLSFHSHFLIYTGRSVILQQKMTYEPHVISKPVINIMKLTCR